MSVDTEEELQLTVAMKIADETTDELNNINERVDETKGRIAELRGNMRLVSMGIRDIINVRQTIDFLVKAMKEADPWAFLSGIMNMMQVMSGTISLLQALTKVSWLASAAQAALQVLTGNPWIIPVALGAAAIFAAMAGAGVPGLGGASAAQSGTTYNQNINVTMGIPGSGIDVSTEIGRWAVREYTSVR